MEPGTDHAALLARFRGMALLTLLLGPSMVLIAIATAVLSRIYHWLLTQPGAQLDRIPAYFDALLEFALQSGLITGPLGLVLTYAGWRAYRGSDRAKGRKVLIDAAWATILAMVLLAVLWSLSIARAELELSWHVIGAGTHLAQAIAVYLAVRVLRAPAMIEACGG